MLRYKWNEVCVGVAAVVGAKALEEYVLPLIVLSLAGWSFCLFPSRKLASGTTDYLSRRVLDPEEFVTVKVLETLTTLASRRLLAKSKTWELVQASTGFLCHPNIWIREGESVALHSLTSAEILRTD